MSAVKIWEQYWRDRTLPTHRFETEDFYKQVAAEMTALFQESKPSTVMEIGCGNGALYRHLGFAGVKYKGIDFSPSMLSVFTKANPGVNVELADASAYKDHCKWDLIFSNAVIQYFDREMVIRHFANARSMMHSSSVFVCGSVPDRAKRFGYVSGKLVPPYRFSVYRLAVGGARRLLMRPDWIGYWYTSVDIRSIAAANNMSAAFYPCNSYQYRFHAVMKLKEL